MLKSIFILCVYITILFLVTIGCGDIGVGKIGVINEKDISNIILKNLSTGRYIELDRNGSGSRTKKEFREELKGHYVDLVSELSEVLKTESHNIGAPELSKINFSIVINLKDKTIYEFDIYDQIHLFDKTAQKEYRFYMGLTFNRWFEWFEENGLCAPTPDSKGGKDKK